MTTTMVSNKLAAQHINSTEGPLNNSGMGRESS